MSSARGPPAWTQLDLARIQFASTSIYHFFFVPVTIGLAFLVAILHTAWYRIGRARLRAADPLLRDAAADQRRDRRRHRPGAGVPVRHELVGLLAVRRRRLRRSAGDGGPRRVLPGVDVPGAVGLRLEGAAARRPSALGWLVAAGAMLSAAFIMAANSWMQHPVGYKTDPDTGRPVLNDIWRPVHQPGLHLGLHPRDPRVAGDRRPGDARGLGMAAAARKRRRSRRPAMLSLVVAPARRPAAAGRGQPARRDRDDVPADEDRGRRGAVGDVPALLVLALPDRRRHNDETPTKIIEVPHLLSMLATAPGTARSSG